MTGSSGNPVETIEGWMSRLLETERLDRFEDLHIDQIDPRYASRVEWMEGAVRCLRIAADVRRRGAYPVTVCVGLGLRDANDADHGFPASLDALHEEIDWSPPSLYAFAPGDEPWKADGDLCAATLPLSGATPVLAHYCQWHDAAEGAFRRSAWLVEADGE